MCYFNIYVFLLNFFSLFSCGLWLGSGFSAGKFSCDCFDFTFETLVFLVVHFNDMLPPHPLNHVSIHVDLVRFKKVGVIRQRVKESFFILDYSASFFSKVIKVFVVTLHSVQMCPLLFVGARSCRYSIAMNTTLISIVSISLGWWVNSWQICLFNQHPRSCVDSAEHRALSGILRSAK